ncbi:Com family DNA-binding transcriptional regulator [Hafnia paralvei]|uniref:Com family DNA-binding transcriptional regulator n=1 Tax=Hafnia paralvei TaxID=546367 RepID=UPI002032E425|nr:Com family DNA-binding transcriptional regulator [Hafnia paralvei]
MSKEVRCCRCHRLLAKASYSYIQIKCPRCKAFNELRASSPLPSAIERPTENYCGDQK